MKRFNRTFAFLAVVFATMWAMSSFAQDDIYYIPGQTASQPTETQQYSDTEGNTYVTNNYYNSDNDEYVYYDDFEYSTRLRRFHHSYNNFGYYSNYYTNPYFYDPFWAPAPSFNSWWRPSFAVSFGFGNPWGWNNWNRWNYNNWACNNWGWNNWGYNNNWAYNNWGYNNWGWNNPYYYGGTVINNYYGNGYYGNGYYQNDYNNNNSANVVSGPRGGGRSHTGNDAGGRTITNTPVSTPSTYTNNNESGKVRGGADISPNTNINNNDGRAIQQYTPSTLPANNSNIGTNPRANQNNDGRAIQQYTPSTMPANNNSIGTTPRVEQNKSDNLRTPNVTPTPASTPKSQTPKESKIGKFLNNIKNSSSDYKSNTSSPNEGRSIHNNNSRSSGNSSIGSDSGSGRSSSGSGNSNSGSSGRRPR